MRRRARLVIWLTLAGAIGIVGYFAFFFFWIFLTATCSNDTVGQFPSPHNENHVAVVIEQNCGATTDFATSVAIIYAGSAVDRDKDYFFSVKGRNKIEVVWDEYGNFTVVYDRPSRIHRQAIIWQTMPIRYRERETPTKREE